MSEDDSPETDSPRDRVSDRLEAGAERALDEFDQRLVDLLSWLLETETKARIYVYLRTQPHSTSEEIAAGTGLYPSTVREALAEMADDAVVERHKRENEGAGNNPYEYRAMAPSTLVSSATEQVQDQLNTVFNLDSHLNDEDPDPDSEPVTISVAADDTEETEETDDTEETDEHD